MAKKVGMLYKKDNKGHALRAVFRFPLWHPDRLAVSGSIRGETV
ncbi:hypothetical protein [Tunturiibacter gelidiferens]|uniref:Uncharacterized protein n=1 Tax=Tunturiibacter gelidiferens TaxID=3069689 RepID=A0AAU7YY03_9BACT